VVTAVSPVVTVVSAVETTTSPVAAVVAVTTTTPVVVVSSVRFLLVVSRLPTGSHNISPVCCRLFAGFQPVAVRVSPALRLTE
jgi:hypothetical protein